MSNLRVVFYIRVLIHVVCFATSFYALEALNFEKLLKQNKAFQARLLYIMLAGSLGYLSAQLIIEMIYQLTIW